VELIDVRLPLRRTAAPGATPGIRAGHRGRPRRAAATALLRPAARSRSTAVTDQDAQLAASSVHREPERAVRPRFAHPASGDYLAQRRHVRHRVPDQRSPAHLSEPVPGPARAQVPQTRHADTGRAGGSSDAQQVPDMRQHLLPVLVVIRPHRPSLLRSHYHRTDPALGRLAPVTTSPPCSAQRQGSQHHRHQPINRSGAPRRLDLRRSSAKPQCRRGAPEQMFCGLVVVIFGSGFW
jgi:hypothetical protein